VDRAGLRRKLLKAQAEAGDIVLLFGDESEALTHPYLAHVWAKKGADLRIPAPGQSAKVAMLGVLDWARRKLIVRTSRTKRSSDFIALLEEIERRYGPKRGVVLKPLVLVLDNGPIHTSKASRAALAARPLAHRRVAAEICSRAERYRGSLARPEAASPRSSDVQRPG
jgi:DDE superfamily endonuclease